MNHKPFSNEGEAISDQDYKKTTKLKKRSNPNRLEKSPSTQSNVTNSAIESNWFWHKYSCWSSFKRGLLWGIIVTSTAIFSAGFGAALSKIDAVEQAIVNNILPNVNKQNSANSIALDIPLNILLIEIKPNNQSMVKFEPGDKSESKKILVLKFDPRIGLAQVINIPLDSRVKVPGLGWGTIANAHRHGGKAMTTQMVEQLMTNVKIDRHLQATSQTYQRLTNSGKLSLKGCDSRILDCDSTSKQIEIQEEEFEAIRQRLNIPAYLSSFQQEVKNIGPNLDSNISAREFIAIANFVKTLDRDNVSINFIPSYTPGEITNVGPSKISASPQLQNTQKSQNQDLFTSTLSKKIASFEDEKILIIDHPIAVENTTDNLELGKKVVNYLRSQNFQNVHLVGHIPLELEQTKIIAGQGQLRSARYLQDILGFGDLKHNENNKNRAVTVRIGNDASYLAQYNRL